MRKQVRKLITGFFFLAFFSGVYAQTPGIRIAETKIKSTVYEIKIKDLSGPVAAGFIDQKFMEKQGILSSVTLAGTKICRVECLSYIGEKELRLMIEGLGFSIAKTFE